MSNFFVIDCIQFPLPCVEQMLAFSGGGNWPRMSTREGSLSLDSLSARDVDGSLRARDADTLGGLMVRVQQRDAAALEALYDATCSRLFALASAILRSREDAEEVVCDCFTQAWDEAERYDAGRATVTGWLTMLCRSRALDRLRQRRHQHLAVEIEAAESVPDPAAAPDELLALLEESSRVRAALSQLPDDRRELIALAFLRGLSHQEIAELKGLPLGTVKSHVRRSLLQLRSALDGADAGGAPA